jgi:Secretion system C-terminal sorting domain
MKFLRTRLTFVFFFALIPIGNAQNLVPNPSFEQYITCPQLSGWVDSLVAWSSYRGSPEAFNSCATNQSSGVGMSVPQNSWGYQYAASGQGYCGMYVMQLPYVDAHEFIGCQLLSPLAIGTKYFVSMKIHLADDTSKVDIASNAIGIRFYDTDYSVWNAPIDNFYHIKSDSIHSDSLDWFRIIGSFIPDTAFQYMAIGNFLYDSNTDTTYIGSGLGISYYLVDDVAVSTDSIIAATVSAENSDIPSQFQIFPNPAMTEFSIEGTSGLSSHAFINIYNSSGVLAFNTSIDQSTDLIKIDRNDLPSGLYFVRIVDGNRIVFNEKIILE